MPPLVAQRELVEHDVPRVLALIVGIAQSVYAFAPAIFSLVREYSERRQWLCPPVVPQLGYSSLPRSSRASRSAHFY
jgi:hypothetical protein